MSTWSCVSAPDRMVTFTLAVWTCREAPSGVAGRGEIRTVADFTLRKPEIVRASTFWSAISFFVSLCRVELKRF